MLFLKYSNIFVKLIEGLQKKEKFSVRNVQLDFNDATYKMIISILDFGQRIEIRREEEEYLIYLQGIDGLGKQGIIHQKNADTIIKMLQRITKKQIEEIVEITNGIENNVLRQSMKVHKMKIENKIIREKTKEEIQIQMDRLLDKYNDYMHLYHNPLLTEEKYKKRAEKIMRLLHKMKQK